ncbi:unnamed protein product [Alternaria sp. RS040]
MSIFNKECCGFWDGSFEIDSDKVIWNATMDPAIIFFNFLLPADHMTDNVLPLLQARNLLGGIPLQVASALNEEYKNAREFLALRYAADIADLIIFLTRKRPDLESFEVLWCAAHATYKKIPTTIRERVKRDATAHCRAILHNPQFKFVGPLLGHALKALEVYIRPLATGSSSLIWIDAQLLHDLHDIHELNMDGAKARKTLFDYLQHRHPGVKTLWHSLVQMYNTYDAKNFPQYSTKPISTPSLVLWESFYRHIREDVPLEYPQSRPLVLKRRDNLSKSQGTVEEGEKKRSKRKRKSKLKGDGDVDPVENPALPKHHPLETRPVPGEQPVSQQQSSAATVEILPFLPTVQQPLEKSERKPSKKDRKSTKRKLEKLRAAVRSESSVAEEYKRSVVGNNANSGSNVTSMRTTMVEVLKDDDCGSTDDDDDYDGVCLTSPRDPTDNTSVKEGPAREDSSDKEAAAQKSKVSAANVYIGISAEKRTLHGSCGDTPNFEEEDHAKSSDNWQKVGVRKDLPQKQKQKQRKNDRNIGKDVPNTTSHVPIDTKSLPVEANVIVSSANSLEYNAEPRSMKVKAPVPYMVTSELRNDNSQVPLDQCTSWSALFKGFTDARRCRSLQTSDVSTDTAGAQSLTSPDTESHGSIQKNLPSLDHCPFVRSETSIDEEVSKSSAAYSTTALPPLEDADMPVDSLAVRDADISQVEQWLMIRYASAFVGLTQAKIESAHWRPE